MHPDHREALERRVVQAAEGALAHHQYVSAIDVLTGMGLLAPTHLQAWRKGRVDFLERVIQGNLKKISLLMATFRRWAQAKGLRPSETRYVRTARVGTVDLQFSKSGDPAIEKSYRTHYVSLTLSERKQQQINENQQIGDSPSETSTALIAAMSQAGACVQAASGMVGCACARIGLPSTATASKSNLGFMV